jgi:transposase InsO family protein
VIVTGFFSRSVAWVRVSISPSPAKRAITHWINHYHPLRQHSSINNLSPIEWELHFARRQSQEA